MMKTGILALLLILSFAAITAEGDEVVATIDGKPILESAIVPLIDKQLRDLHHAEYELKREALEQYLFEQIQQRLADEEGIPVTTLWAREVEAKAPAPTEAQIMSVLQQNRARLPRDENEARALVARFIEERLIEQRARSWRDELLAETAHEILLEPVRYPIRSLGGDAVIGAVDAPITIVEFSDFQCPYCAQAQPVLEKLEEHYGDSIRIVFKHLPLDIHPEARLAAEASLCAREQGKFRELHDWLFENPRRIQVATMKEVAPSLGLDGEGLETCVQENRYSDEVAEQMAQAEELGVNSTPSFFVNGRKMADRSYEAFSRLIDEELKILQREKARK
jgi:predicted DsbA family dithiol-disulfide isomerase